MTYRSPNGKPILSVDCMHVVIVVIEIFNSINGLLVIVNLLDSFSVSQWLDN